MLKKATVVGLFVADKNEALAFYTEKLGFVIRTDVTNGDYRWLTVGLPDQPELEFVFNEIKSDSSLSQDEAAALSTMLRDGKLGGYVIDTDDIHGVHRDLTAKGVEFVSPPTERGWGTVDAQIKDNSGNTWLLLQQNK